MKLLELKCKNCGAALKVKPDTTDIHCTHCKASYKLDDEFQHIKFDDMEKAGYDYERGKQKARQVHEQRKQIEADKQRIEKIRKSQTKTERFIYDRLYSAISKQVMQETIEKHDDTAVTNHTEDKESKTSGKQSSTDFVSQNSKKIIIGALIALFVVAPLTLFGLLLFSPLKKSDSDVPSIKIVSDGEKHEDEERDTEQDSELNSETDDKKDDKANKTISSCQKNLEGFTPKEGVYNVDFKIKVTSLSVECNAYSGWDYYTATLEITNIDKSHDKNWYTTSHTTLSQYEITEGYDHIPVFYDSNHKRIEFTLPDYLPKKDCRGIVQNGEWIEVSKGQTIKSAICGWIPSDAKNIIYSYHHYLSDYTDLLHLTLLTKS